MSALDCSWDHPGNSRYTGTVAAAIASYRLPIATQQSLIDQWERREFADTVVIDRDSIRGRTGSYAPQIRQMHFGSKGKTCATVTRDGWAEDHAETAVVLCASGECVMVPSICGNVSRITRLDESPATPAAFLPDTAPELPTDATGAGFAATPAPDAPAAATYATTGYAVGEFIGAGSFGAFGGSVCTCCEGVPVAAVPEPSTVALLLAGLGALAVRSTRRMK